jgi:hypothetical protein
MKLRAVFLDGIVFLLWASYVFFINLDFGILGYSWNFLFSGIGIVFGLVLGISESLKALSSLEKNGEFKTTLKTMVLMLLTIIIIIPIAIYLLLSYGPILGIPMLSFIYPSLLALYVARITLYLNWERKNQKLILFDGQRLQRVYVAPRNSEEASSR